MTSKLDAQCHLTIYTAPRTMSRKYSAPVLTGFFLVVSVAVIMRLITPGPKHDARFQESALALELEKIALQRQHLQRNADVWFYGSIGAISSLCLAVLIVAAAIHRERVKRAQVHTYRIGASEIVIHERDLTLAAPIAMGLLNAEQLKQMNGGLEKAFELSCRMAEVQSRQIQALMQGSRIFPALPAPAAPEAVSMAAPVPTFRELLDRGTIGPQAPLLFGFTSDQRPRAGSWKEIYSNATGGQSGSGKTNTLLSLIAQSLLQGIGFWVIDYHWPHDESLLAKLGPLRCSVQYAEAPIDVRTVLEDVNACIDRRLAKQEPSTPIRVLCIDEVLQIVKNCRYAETIIERIGTEGRKVNVFGLFAAQSWKADKVDTTARDNLTSIFAHYMKPNQARLLLQDSDKEKLLKRLHRGQMVFCPALGDPEVLTVPHVTPEDLRCVASVVNTSVTSHHVDQPVDQTSQPTGLVRAGPVDLVDQVNACLQNEGDFSALVQSTGFDKAYMSRILNRKQAMSKNAEERLQQWMKNHERGIL